MALDIETKYPGKSNAADADYPFGSARNITTPGDGQGTPLEQAWLNDSFGFQQSLLAAASLTPSGNPDTVLASQYFDSLLIVSVAMALNAAFEEVILATNTTTVLDNVLFIHDKTQDLTFGKPEQVGAGETIVSVVGSVLTTSAGTYELISLNVGQAPKADKEVYAQTQLDSGFVEITGAIALSTPLLYGANGTMRGDGKSFSGTILTPSGDFPAFKEDPGLGGDHTKNTFSDFLIDAANITTNYAIEVENSFLTSYSDIWVRNSTKGISILNSDSVTFNDVMVMEDSDGDCVTVGNNARDLRFFACNFEKNPGNNDPGGVFRVDSGLNGVSGRLSDAYLYGCQFERGVLIVENGTAKMYGGKMGASSAHFLEMSQQCYIETKFGDSGEIIDIGFNNVAVGVQCRNMMTPRHEWPRLEQVVAGSTPTFGAVGEEYLFLVTAGSTSNASVTSGLIEIKDGATVLDASPSFTMPAAGTTIGLPARQLYTHLSAVKIPTASAGPVFTDSKSFGIAGGINLLVNGTFDSGVATGWSFNSVAESPSGGDVLLTPADTSWGIFQNVASICKFGKRYLVVARFNGNANLVMGDAWNGTAGARVLYSEGVAAPDGSGDTIAMLAFEYQNQRSNLSLGKLGASTPVTVKYFMMIEV